MKYIDKMHRWGRIWAIITCSIIIGFPFAVAGIFNAWPDFGTFMSGFLPTALSYWSIGIVEVIMFTPMLGVGGTYLGFVTGNLTSLKVPCALDCMEKANVKSDSDEGEVISTLSIATSSIVTILIIALGVVLLIFFNDFLTSDILAPAYQNVLPALFGGLGVVYLSRYFKIAVLPVCLMLAMFIFLPFMTSGIVGVMIPVSMIITVVYARFLYKKGAFDKADPSKHDSEE